MGDTIAVIIDGRVRQVGPVGDVFSRPADAGIASAPRRRAVLAASVIGSSGGVTEVAVAAVTLHAVEREAMTPGTAVSRACAPRRTLETRGAGQRARATIWPRAWWRLRRRARSTA